MWGVRRQQFREFSWGWSEAGGTTGREHKNGRGADGPDLSPGLWLGAWCPLLPIQGVAPSPAQALGLINSLAEWRANSGPPKLAPYQNYELWSMGQDHGQT